VFAIDSGNSALGEFFLSTGLINTLITALIFLPFILLFKRGLNLARRGKPKLPLRLSLLPPVILFIAAAALAGFLFFTR
jgi:hypothetical protein